MAIGAQVNFQVTLTPLDCGECGGVYAINEKYRQQCREEGKFWTCPYCKCQWGYSEGTNARLQRELEAAKQGIQREKARHDQTQAALREKEKEARRIEQRRLAQKSATTRLKNRIASGACPCCHKKFQDVAAHMAEQHPTFATKE